MKSLNLPTALKVDIVLPSSKSLCNRLLIIAALSRQKMNLHNLSDCDDTRVLMRALSERSDVIDVMAAGTAMRFATAFFASTEGGHVITGTARMRQRPISVLVDALRQLGADIAYVENEGFPPLRIKGKKLVGGELVLPANVSSQYISALLMIAPTLERGLRLHLQGEIISRPYIDMTLQLMANCGAQVEWEDATTIFIAPQPYEPPSDYCVESDWSAASYWYEFVALSSDKDARVVLPHLFQNSLQGDSRLSDYFLNLGVQTTFTEEGVVLTKGEEVDCGEMLHLDLSRQPDLAQTLVVTCAMLKKPFHFTGLQTLKIKETDRITALRTELLKMGISVGEANDSELFCETYDNKVCANSVVEVATYDDHRMAMAFAPCAYFFPNLRILHPEVVSKSYPAFWEDVAKI